MQRTLGMIKPDALAAGRAGRILAQIEAAGLRVEGLRLIQLSEEQARTFYAVHRQRPFFDSLVAFMTSGPCVVLVMAADDAIERWRTLMGATDPAKAAANTVRALHGTNVERNAVHGSDAPETARDEIAFFSQSLSRWI